MTVVVRRDRLRTAWGQLGAVALAVLAIYIVLSRSLPWWADALGLLAIWWLVSAVVQAHGSVALGRVLGFLAALTVLVFAALSGWWLLLAAPLILGALGLAYIRVRGSHKVDAAGIDRTMAPMLDDDGDRLVDAIDGVWGSTRSRGERRGLRAVHTHGSMAVGTWEAAWGGAEPSAVAMFRPGGRGRALVRFSDFPGDVERDDTRRRPHGMAIHLDDGGSGSIDLVLVDIERFPVSTREDFISFTHAFASRGLTRIWGFTWLVLTGRSSLVSIVGLFQRARVSYLDRRYHGLNTLRWRFTPGDDRVPVRYVAIPTHRGKRKAPKKRSGLDSELRTRLQAGSVTFEVRLVQGTTRAGRPLAEEILEDPMHRYPLGRRSVALCRITLERYVEEGTIAGWGFDPFNLPDGVEPSDDEILHARRAAYPVSQVRRGRAIEARQ